MNSSNLQNKQSIMSKVSLITLFIWHCNEAAYNVNYAMN